jgi:uncharacterized protein YbaR (Trm112 family)
MGMFDTVYFKCPKCNGSVYRQSKAGECMLNNYTSDAVPIYIAADIVDDKIYCESCKESFTIICDKIPTPQIVPMQLK